MAFSYKDYQESDRVKKLAERLAQLESQKPGDWTGGQYGQQMQEALDAIRKRKKFSYDLNGDALYQQYKDKYVQQGKQAMQDTMGQAAALTGGYGSTYGQAVGQQQYDAYLQNLNDVVPELYQLALSRYQMEGDDLKTQYSLLADQYQQEYGQYRDKVGDWQTERNFLSGRYDSERNLDYGMWGDARDFAYTDYRNGIADEQWRRQYEESVRQFNEQMALSREQFAWAAGTGAGGCGGKEQRRREFQRRFRRQQEHGEFFLQGHHRVQQGAGLCKGGGAVPPHSEPAERVRAAGRDHRRPSGTNHERTVLT